MQAPCRQRAGLAHVDSTGWPCLCRWSDMQLHCRALLSSHHPEMLLQCCAEPGSGGTPPGHKKQHLVPWLHASWGQECLAYCMAASNFTPRRLCPAECLVMLSQNTAHCPLCINLPVWAQQLGRVRPAPAWQQLK